MNTASEDLPHHLRVLREKLLHPTDYELAVTYFLEEFAGDVKFLHASLPDDARHLVTVLQHVVAKATGEAVEFDGYRVFHLPEQRFYHGNAVVRERVVLFFYFQEANTGAAALIPGRTGGMEVLRFRLPTGLVDPRNN